MVDIFVFVMLVRVGLGHLFLQLVTFTGHACLLSKSLLLCEWLLGSHLGLFFVLLTSEGAALMYSVDPGV